LGKKPERKGFPKKKAFLAKEGENLFEKPRGLWGIITFQREPAFLPQEKRPWVNSLGPIFGGAQKYPRWGNSCGPILGKKGFLEKGAEKKFSFGGRNFLKRGRF